MSCLLVLIAFVYTVVLRNQSNQIKWQSTCRLDYFLFVSLSLSLDLKIHLRGIEAKGVSGYGIPQ